MKTITKEKIKSKSPDELMVLIHLITKNLIKVIYPNITNYSIMCLSDDLIEDALERLKEFYPIYKEIESMQDEVLN